MSYIGVIGAARLDELRSSSCLMSAQKEAVRLIKSEVGMRSIKLQTGWEIGVDGRWRYEINDTFHTTLEIEDHVKRHFGEPINIRYCMRDTILLDAYPDFGRLRLFSMYSPMKRYSGYFCPDDYGMVVCMGTSNSPFQYQIEGILLHEVQHLIQDIENFARGGNLSQGRNRYHRLAGEVESRNVCQRHFLNPDQRRASLRIDTQDVPDDRQIITFV